MAFNNTEHDYVMKLQRCLLLGILIILCLICLNTAEAETPPFINCELEHSVAELDIALL